MVRRAIADRLVRNHAELRRALLRSLRRTDPGLPLAAAAARAREQADRLLFVAFAETRGLPASGMAEPGEGIPGRIPDDVRSRLEAMSSRDLRAAVPVDVLGHLYERSLADPGLRGRSASGRSRRRAEGVFYTLPFAARYIVAETLGRTMRERFEAAVAAVGAGSAIDVWTRYRDALRSLRVLDPACGSGAFLVAAFQVLKAEYRRVDAALAEQGEPLDADEAILAGNLFGVDRDPAAVAITKRCLWLETTPPGGRVAWLDGNVRCGDSVVDDPDVDPRAFDWARVPAAGPDGAGEPDDRWRGGFDVLIGNPPYIRQELLTASKHHLERSFRAWHGAADIYVYFFERGLSLLAPGGRLGFIVSNKWLRGGYAAPLRELLAAEAEVEEIIDFGHAPILFGADASPVIVTLRKRPEAQGPPPDHQVRVTRFPREELAGSDLREFVEAHSVSVPQARLGAEPWSLEPPAVDSLMRKLAERGEPLQDYAGTKPFYGIKTGRNAAFLIDGPTRARLIRDDPGSEAVIHPFLRGQDVGRWASEWRGQYMILARHGIDIDAFPAIRAHLERHRAALEPRPRDWPGGSRDWPGRKPGRYRWYEIQDAVEYWRAFLGPKIVYQEIQFHPSFALDRSGLFTNNKAFILPTDDPWLLAVLNAPLTWWHNWRYLPHMKDETLSPTGARMVRLPVPRPSEAVREEVGALVERTVARTRENLEARRAVLDVLGSEFGIARPGAALIDFARLDPDAFVREVVRRRPREAGRPGPAALLELRRMHDEAAAPMRARQREIRAAEGLLSDRVNAAFGLSAQEVELVRRTAPPRTPPGLPERA